MSYTDNYKINLIGGSYRVTVPIDWVRENGVKHKDSLRLLVNDFVLIMPPKRLSDNEITRSFEDMQTLTRMVMRQR